MWSGHGEVSGPPGSDKDARSLPKSYQKPKFCCRLQRNGVELQARVAGFIKKGSRRVKIRDRIGTEASSTSTGRELGSTTQQRFYPGTLVAARLRELFTLFRSLPTVFCY